MTAGTTTVRELLEQVTDPEIPVLTIEDLGILRDVTVDASGHVEVVITPTYSGCPAMDVIRHDVETVLAENGYAEATVRTQLAPAWTTDWMSDEGRRKLEEFGIAPPTGRAGGEPVLVQLTPACPHCGSHDTRLVSRFGSTACKALHVCSSCNEPFDHFKVI
jgi:ring-1,2-phenylacetyl-CoA epoxidase subunit PaaD